MLSALKEYAGVLLKDSGRYRRALQTEERAANGDPLWLHLCNRNETLDINPAGPGVRCPWRWTSDLHACGVKPDYGRQLAARAFRDWPITFAESVPPADKPDVSFIIAHEGRQRVKNVDWVTRSILGQQETQVECLVVDQTAEPAFKEELSDSVQYLHRPRPDGLTGWRKSWAFNQGARAARGDILVFHDGDIICPNNYASALLDAMQSHAAASIQRFLFNLDQNDTTTLFETSVWPQRLQPERVRQNWEGGTIAVRRDAFFEMGGYDEAFVGWGGEDNEFFDRCSAVGHFKFGSVPFVHLWHPAQTDKHASDNKNINGALDERLKIPAESRMAELRSRSFGDPVQPDPLKGYRGI